MKISPPETPAGFEISVAFLEDIVYNTPVIRVWPSWGAKLPPPVAEEGS